MLTGLKVSHETPRQKIDNAAAKRKPSGQDDQLANRACPASGAA